MAVTFTQNSWILFFKKPNFFLQNENKNWSKAPLSPIIKRSFTLFFFLFSFFFWDQNDKRLSLIWKMCTIHYNSSTGSKWADQAATTRVSYNSELSVCAVGVGILWSDCQQAQVSPSGESEYVRSIICSLRSRLPTPWLPTSPTRAGPFSVAADEKGWKNPWLFCCISEPWP